MKRKKDKYDLEVEFLSAAKPGEFQELVWRAWTNADPLFQFAGPDGKRGGEVPDDDTGEEHDCGCLTQVRDGSAVASTPELTAAIRADKRLPTSPRSIKRKHLPVFAEWQRRLDKELGRG